MCVLWSASLVGTMVVIAVFATRTMVILKMALIRTYITKVPRVMVDVLFRTTDRLAVAAVAATTVVTNIVVVTAASLSVFVMSLPL